MSPIYDIDFNQYDENGYGITAPGVYHVEVAEVKVTKTKAGDPMLNVKLISVGLKKHVCYDNICLAGGGAGMGIAKLIELGLPKGAKLDTDRLIGRRVAVTIGHTEYQGKKRAEVDIRAAGFKCGYLAEHVASERELITAGITAQAPMGEVADAESSPF